MRLSVRQGSIVDEPADAIVVSANTYLNLSGGVGATLLQRYGKVLQTELHNALASSGKRFLQPGDLHLQTSERTPYKLLAHAVAVDVYYKSTVERVADLLHRAATAAGDAGAETLAVTALATGFGDLTMAQFAEAFASLRQLSNSHLKEVFVVVEKQRDFDELSVALELPGQMVSGHD